MDGDTVISCELHEGLVVKFKMALHCSGTSDANDGVPFKWIHGPFHSMDEDTDKLMEELKQAEQNSQQKDAEDDVTVRGTLGILAFATITSINVVMTRRDVQAKVEAQTQNADAIAHQLEQFRRRCLLFHILQTSQTKWKDDPRG